MTTEVELVVLGGGPGGYPAAFDAADHGIDVTLIDEQPEPGGVCLHRGCIPSKALLHVAKLINESRDAAEWGVTFAPPEIDLDQLRTYKSNVIGKLTGGIVELCKARGVKRIRARGRFLDSNTLKLTQPDGTVDTLPFRHCIVATGSAPVMPPVFDIGDDRVMDSTGALELRDVPGRLLIVGGGYIGLELGTVYAALGSRVTVVEMTSSLLPGADRDLVRPLQKRLQNQFAAIHLNTKVESLSAESGALTAVLSSSEGERQETFDRVLIAVGRSPNSRDLGLEHTRVKVDERGFILGLDDTFWLDQGGYVRTHGGAVADLTAAMLPVGDQVAVDGS